MHEAQVLELSVLALHWSRDVNRCGTVLNTSREPGVFITPTAYPDGRTHHAQLTLTLKTKERVTTYRFFEARILTRFHTPHRHEFTAKHFVEV